jgi:hypothetical protein
MGCSKADIGKNQSDLVIERQLDLSDLSVLSIEGLDSLFLRESVSVESEDALLQFILKLGSGYRDFLRHIQIEFLSDDGLSLLNEHFGIPPESIWQCAAERIAHPPPPPLDSRIISDFPEIFAEFRGKRFSLLWRGSRDGFKTQEFHGRCDAHGNILTVILDTKGNIFGGFTPLEWESRVWNRKYDDENNCWKADDSQMTFLFTLKNPHNISARRFALKAKEKHHAILCYSTSGPHFYQIAIFDNCNANTNSCAFWNGSTDAYINDTGLDGTTFLTGSTKFQAEEIEVFEITD